MSSWVQISNTCIAKYFATLQTFNSILQVINLETLNSFLILKINLSWWISRSMLDPPLLLISRLTSSCTCILKRVNKIQPIRVAYQKPENLKFSAPFKINIQKREGFSNFDKPVFDFLYYIQKKSGLSKKLKVSTLDIRIKQSGLKVSHSKVPSSDSFFFVILYLLILID